jgi:hypothetical protein
MASRVPNSLMSRVLGTPGKTSARSPADGRFMTVSAAAMMKAGLPVTLLASASRARRQDWATSRWSM